MARPIKELDEETIYKLAALGCSYNEIAKWFNVSKDTLTRRYQDIIKEGAAQVKMDLKRKQLEVAMGGNVTMLIWLGKQMLDQREPRDQTRDEQEAPDGIIIEEIDEVQS
jgi:hypothetical protein